MLVTYVPRAVRAGALVFADCRVERILAEGGRAVGARAEVIDRDTNRPTGAIVEARAKVVVLAAGGYGSAPLLLRSGLANSSGQVGRNLHANPCSMVFGLFDEDVVMWRNIPAAYGCLEWRLPRRGDDGAYREGGYLLMPNQLGPAAVAAFLPGFGAEHRRRMEALPRLASTIAWIDDVELVSPTGEVVPVIGQFDTTPMDDDTAWFNRAYGDLLGGASLAGARKPLVRGETGKPSSAAILAAGPFSARPPTMGDTPTTGLDPSSSRIPGTARIGSRLTHGLEGANRIASARVRASSTPGAGRAASAPSKRNARTTGRQPRATKYSWKASSPSSEHTIVRSGSSLTGSTATRMPNEAAMRCVTSLSARPEASSDVRRMWTARSRSPRRNHVGPPSRASESRKAQVSSARPQPVSGFSRPARCR